MSYGATAPCFAEYVQLQVATAKGITLVAAAGNELSAGNPLVFPASLPHVLTVAAVGADLKAPYFSSASAAVDLAAPGVGILSATPPQFDEDGERDGYEAVDRHELLGADGGRRRRVAARREAATSRSTRSRRRCAGPRATSAARAGTRRPASGCCR